MSIFCYQKIQRAMRFGQKLTAEREKSGQRLEAVAEATRIPLKYLQALEAGDFALLPKAKAHRLAYVRTLANYYHLPEKNCFNQFVKEDGLADTDATHPRTGIKLFPFSSIAIFLRNGVLISCVLLFAGYLLWQVKGILEPPYLAVFSPGEGFVVSKPQTTIEGETEKETKLTVNGQEIMVNEAGKFSTQIDLSSGVNTIVISVVKKHGKTTTITRHVVVKQPIGAATSQTTALGVK